MQTYKTFREALTGMLASVQVDADPFTIVRSDQCASGPAYCVEGASWIFYLAFRGKPGDGVWYAAGWMERDLIPA